VPAPLSRHGWRGDQYGWRSGSTVGGTAGATANTAALRRVQQRQQLSRLAHSSSTGVIGLQGLSLNSELSNATQVR